MKEKDEWRQIGVAAVFLMLTVTVLTVNKERSK